MITTSSRYVINCWIDGRLQRLLGDNSWIQNNLPTLLSPRRFASPTPDPTPHPPASNSLPYPRFNAAPWVRHVIISYRGLNVSSRFIEWKFAYFFPACFNSFNALRIHKLKRKENHKNENLNMQIKWNVINRCFARCATIKNCLLFRLRIWKNSASSSASITWQLSLKLKPSINWMRAQSRSLFRKRLSGALLNTNWKNDLTNQPKKT